MIMLQKGGVCLLVKIKRVLAVLIILIAYQELRPLIGLGLVIAILYQLYKRLCLYYQAKALNDK